MQLSLVEQTPDFAPIYTEDGILVKNPSIGYCGLMFAPVCTDESNGILGVACPWAHGDINSNITLLDNE